MLVKVDRSAFAEPVGKSVIVAEEDHQLHLLLCAPVLVLEDGLPLDLFFLVLVVGLCIQISFFLQLGVALCAS